MELKEKKPLIILLAGKARSGKNTIANYIKEYFENKQVIISPYTKYLKKYIEEITNKPITEENKPRELLQKLSSELIKKKLKYNNIFIERQIEDINIYSYFFDIIIIPDVRFPNEIETIRNNFKNVYAIGIKRNNYQTDLTKEQQQDITETSLDNYSDYDYIIDNNDINKLKDKILEVIKKIEERR